MVNHNITLFISVHHNLLSKEKLISSKNKIIYVKQDNILDCLAKSSLIISDFSSVIFDLIYQNKPFIIYIPDCDDKDIKDIYSIDYVNIINGLKNGSIYFENKFFNVNDTVKKIIYYINKDFELDKTLKKFYSKFQFKGRNHTKTLINFLKDLI